MKAKEFLLQYLISGGYLKTSGIIEAFRAIDRADFVPPEYRSEAYENYPLPIGQGQTISQPLTVAFMLELLDPQPGEKILDVGSGSGWTSALLAYIVSKKETGKVFSIERIPQLCEFGRTNLEKYDFSRKDIVEYFCQDGALGIADKAPFDKILASAAASVGDATQAAIQSIPEAWKKQLVIGGKIVAPVGNSVRLFTKKTETDWEEQEFPGFLFVPLIADKRIPLLQNPQGEKKNEKPEEKSAKRAETKSRWNKKTYRMGILFFVALMGIAANEVFLPHGGYSGTKNVTITAGLGSRKIAELLKQEGMIRSKLTFVAYVSIRGAASSLKPGVYEFNTPSIAEIAQTLVQGNAGEQTITIPEGWSNNDIAEYFERERVADRNQFLELANAQYATLYKETFDFLKDKPDHAGLEGYLFPDTYRVFIGSEPKEIIMKMLENFDRKLTPGLRAEIARQKKSIFDIVIVASLIEKEVRHDEDRALVSGILWKRIQYGIPLQIDATITYITGKNSVRISREETKISSPYNTYLYPGLPKGPIANPGMSAIRAAIFPKESPFLYYLSTPEGRTIFSKTLEEHNKAKAKYLR